MAGHHPLRHAFAAIEYDGTSAYFFVQFTEGQWYRVDVTTPDTAAIWFNNPQANPNLGFYFQRNENVSARTDPYIGRPNFFSWPMTRARAHVPVPANTKVLGTHTIAPTNSHAGVTRVNNAPPDWQP